MNPTCEGDLYTIPIAKSECIGNSLITINRNFSELDKAVCNLENTVEDNSVTGTTTIQLISSAVEPIGSTYATESSFVYTANTSQGTANLTNQWQDVFINKTLGPMRVAFTSPSVAKTAYISARLVLRYYDCATSCWARLGLFGSGNRTTHPTPTQIIDSTNVEGHAGYSETNNIELGGFYRLLPNTNYTFGLQSYFYATGAAGNGAIEVNGWHIDGPGGDGGGNRNKPTILNASSFTDIYAESPSTAPVSPTQNIGIGSSATLPINRVRNISYIKIAIL